MGIAGKGAKSTSEHLGGRESEITGVGKSSKWWVRQNKSDFRLNQGFLTISWVTDPILKLI